MEVVEVRQLEDNLLEGEGVNLKIVHQYYIKSPSFFQNIVQIRNVYERKLSKYLAYTF